MRQKLTYLTVIISLVLFSHEGLTNPPHKLKPGMLLLAPPPDSTATGDTINLIYPFRDNSVDASQQQPQSPMYLKEPSNVQRNVEYNPESNEYIINKRIGNFNYRTPYAMPLDEYLKYDQQRAINQYWSERATAAGANARGDGIIPQIYVGGAAFERIFGSNTIDIRPQGSAELTFGVLANRRDDPTLNVRQRNVVNFDFQQRIQMSVLAKIGDKIEFQTNYNTEATFEFENKLNLKYEGKEDEIIQLIEAGNVTLPLNSTLITGSQALFGIKTKLKFGRTTVTAVYSEQKSETSNITVQGGAQTNTFTLHSDEYEENKHFLLGQYFYNNYDSALADLPIIRSNVNITKIEVWVTNIGAAVTENRNIVAFQDLGERNPYSSNIQPGTSTFPDMYASNNLVEKLQPYIGQVRDINSVSNVLTGPPFMFQAGTDFVKVENARKLGPNEYTYNSKLGFISLNTTLNSDQTLAVAYQYQVIGDTTIYQVGEFSDQGIDPPKVLMVKLLKSTSLNTKVPIWKLMMKNVYAIGAYQVQRDDFMLNILYSGNENGVPTSYLSDAGNASGIPLIRVLNFDNLDPQLNPPHDGIFDFIDNAATNGGTIQSSNGRIYFTMLEPFGKYLRSKIGNDEIADQFAYDSLYTLTKNGAQQYPEKNKFIIEGFYKSSSGSEISLNALNVPQGSVRVTAGGVELTENVDYTVDYTLGRVKIINEGVLNSGTPINISLESQSFFNIQTKRLMGTHIDYRVSDDFNIGGTILNLTERPLTQKVNYGDDPISNTIWGMDFAWQTKSRFITKLVDMLPFIKTKEESRVTIDGEFAHFIPGHSKVVGKTGTSYIDDFEGSKSTIDLKSTAFWFLASTPQKQTEAGMFPEAAPNSGREYGYNRAKLAWYIIDPLFYDETGNLRPPNIDLNELSDNKVRQVLETEVFPNKDVPNGIPTNIPILNLAYYPSERGPYNYDVEGVPGISSGMNEDGSLRNPESRWGGIMRKIESTDFEATNVEYIEFWMMDPFTGEDSLNNSGELYFNLGDVSEDILRDSRKAYENGLPTSDVVENVDTTIWGRVPTLQALVDNFSNEADSRQYQDVGYDGLRDDDELSFFDPLYLQRIASLYGTASEAYLKATQDPSNDNYHYFRGSDYDQDPEYSSILERYKNYNGPDGNSPTDAQNPETYPTAATKVPNMEDINRDNTLSESERYFQYKVELDKNQMQVGQNYITDVYHAEGIRLPNGQIGDVKWYQFKIPVRDPDKIVGGIQDFQSIRFMRMFMKGFQHPMVLRFATLDLVRGEWRRYRYDLLSPGEYIPNDVQSETSFDILSVNIEENGKRTPIPYVIPPGIDREINLGTTNLQQLNEQSMVLRVCDLIDGDARGAYKTTDFDFREYGNLQMFVHAEKLLENQDLEYGDLTLFVRIGSDLTENYYEYEIPLTFTPWYTSSSDPEAIWPEANRLNIDLKKLVDFKLQRNIEMRTPGSGVSYTMPYYAYDGPNKVTILGSPSISDVKAIMIGVRNPKKTAFNSNDDGESKCAEIWVNEMRLTDFNSKSGFAATARVKTDLADLGNVTLSGLYSTPGFGSIEKKTNERAKEYTKNFDFSTNLELGKFFPEKFGIRIPMHFDYSESRLTPKYNQLDPDIILKEDLKTYNPSDRDSIIALNEDFVMRKNINFINVRKDRTGASAKSHFYDIENWDVSFSYAEIYARNVDVSYDMQKKYQGGLGYNFNNNPKNYKPFNNWKLVKGKAFALIKDFNFYLMPKLFSFRTDMYREYNKRLLRNKSQYEVIIDPTYLKKWDWTRNYDLKWDLASSLRLDYKANVAAYINELPGSIEKDDPDYDIKKERVRNEILNLGTKNTFSHTLGLNYTIPINKLPLLDWLSSTARYQTNYRWQASPVSFQEQLGNQIENSRTIQVNGNASLDKLYNKLPFLKKVNEGNNSRGRRPSPRPPQRKPPDQKQDTAAKEKKNYFKIVGNTILKLAMSAKRASLSYSRGEGIFMPGFKPEAGIIGNNWNQDAPGLGFVFGDQADIRWKAAKNGWLTADTLLNTKYATKFNEQINFRGTLEPFPDFKIELTADRSYSLNYTEFFKANADGEFNSFSPQEAGSFSMSFFTWATAWVKDNDKDQNPTFEKLKENRRQVAYRLANQNPNWNGNVIDSTGFPEGYGPTQQDVLLYSFLSAYSGKDAGNYTLKSMPKIPMLNWRVTYNGLSRIEPFKKYLRNLTITHGYRSTYSIGSFQTNVLYKEAGGAPSEVNENDNFIPEHQINQVSIIEQFSPLITFDMTWVNSLMTKFEIKKTRNLSMSFTNNQLTEVTSNEFVIGVGYRFKDVKFNIRSMGGSGSRQSVSSDLNVRTDFSIRSNKTVLRRIDEDINQVSTGQKVITINFSADYMVNQRLNVRLFFDKTINNPYVSSQYRNSTTNGGVSLRFTLAQ